MMGARQAARLNILPMVVLGLFMLSGCIAAGPLANPSEPGSAAASAAPVAGQTPMATLAPPPATQAPASNEAGIVKGHVTAGPTCPIEAVSPDPGCAPKPLGGAIVIATDARGAEVARAVSSANGSFELLLAPGTYELTPQALGDKMMRAPHAKAVTVTSSGPIALVDFTYDTGIR